MTGYPGSKNASGVSQRICREIPPHRIYVEAFAGYAAVFRRKLPAAASFLIDADPVVCERLRSYLAVTGEVAGVHCEDALAFVPTMPAVRDPETLVYFDPPYLLETRTRYLYDFEFATRESHEALLDLAMSLPCMVMISGYDSRLYQRRLKSWRLVKFPAMTRGGKRIEHLWCNFREPRVLHDPRFAGENFRDRERIKRKQQRWQRKFERMTPRERQAIAAALVASDDLAVRSALVLASPGASLAAANPRGDGAASD